MGMTSPGPRKQPEPEINVTPLVDVVLVLLIIFMVIAPALEHGERVELPGVSHVDEKQKSKLDPITVTLGASGALFLEKEAVSEPELATRLSEIHDREPDRRVVLKGDSSLAYAKVRSVFALVQSRNISGCSLQVSKKKGVGPESDEN
jgi:biopolymer transport protein TolR